MQGREINIDEEFLDKAVDDVINEFKQTKTFGTMLGDFSDFIDNYVLKNCVSFRSYFQLLVLTYYVVDIYCSQNNDLDFIGEGTEKDYNEVYEGIKEIWLSYEYRSKLIRAIKDEKYQEYFYFAVRNNLMSEWNGLNRYAHRK